MFVDCSCCFPMFSVSHTTGAALPVIVGMNRSCRRKKKKKTKDRESSNERNMRWRKNLLFLKKKREEKHNKNRQNSSFFLLIFLSHILNFLYLLPPPPLVSIHFVSVRPSRDSRSCLLFKENETRHSELLNCLLWGNSFLSTFSLDSGLTYRITMLS